MSAIVPCPGTTSLQNKRARLNRQMTVSQVGDRACQHTTKSEIYLNPVGCINERTVGLLNILVSFRH